MSDEPMAKDGTVYVCAACGKTSPGLYGTGAVEGWDESCMMNAVLCIVGGPPWTAAEEERTPPAVKP